MANRQYITVGVPKEIKVLEGRVGLTPSTAFEYVSHGHTVLIEKSAGAKSGFTDEAYVGVGCKIVETAKEVYAQADMIVKVKEPLPSEYPMLRKKQVVFTYFHFAADKHLTENMVESGAVCVAYETLEVNNSLPLLVPMSEVAGRLAIQKAALYLEKPQGGQGILLGGVPGVNRGKVLILGGGVVGSHAAQMAAGFGADVTILDNNLNVLRHLSNVLPANASAVFSTRDEIVKQLKTADVVIGAVLVVGAKAPLLVTKDMLKLMKPGSVVIDVAVDQGGCIETCKPTTHDNPTYVVEGVTHYCVANMPGCVPATSTMALNNATLPYGLMLADFGWKEACRKRNEIKSALNIVEGKLVCRPVAEAFNLPYVNVEQLFL